MLPSESTEVYEIEDTVSIIVDTEDIDDSLDRGIVDWALTSVDSDSLEIQIGFKSPGDISKDSREPDTLEVRFNYPMLIVAADGLETLKDDFISYKLLMDSQMSKEEYENLKAVIAVVAVIGAGIAIW